MEKEDKRLLSSQRGKAPQSCSTKLTQSLKQNPLSHRDPLTSSKQISRQRVLLCLSLKSIRREGGVTVLQRTASSL